MTEPFPDRIGRWRRALDLTRLRYVGIGAYFLCYGLIAVGLCRDINRLLRMLPASVRPLPIAPVATTVGLPTSVSWGVVSFVVASLAVIATAAVQIRRHEESDGPGDWQFGRVSAADSVTDGGVDNSETAGGEQRESPERDESG